MPIVFGCDLGASTLTIWQITESEEQLQKMVTDDDMRSASNISNYNRRVQHLAGRAMVRMVSPSTPIIYSDVGIPMLSDGSLRLGLAHTQGVVVLITNGDNLACAVDIESTRRNFDAASRRYISSRERELSDYTHPHFEAAMWCAKETMYKYSGHTELNLLEDIEVVELDIERGIVVGEVSIGRERQPTSTEDKQRLEHHLEPNIEGENGVLSQCKTCVREQESPIVNGTIRVEMGLLYYQHYIVVYSL